MVLSSYINFINKFIDSTLIGNLKGTNSSESKPNGKAQQKKVNGKQDDNFLKELLSKNTQDYSKRYLDEAKHKVNEHFKGLSIEIEKLADSKTLFEMQRRK